MHSCRYAGLVCSLSHCLCAKCAMLWVHTQLRVLSSCLIEVTCEPCAQQPLVKPATHDTHEASHLAVVSSHAQLKHLIKALAASEEPAQPPEGSPSQAAATHPLILPIPSNL